MTTGGVHSETFQRTKDAGAISGGCWSIKKEGRIQKEGKARQGNQVQNNKEEW